jgi:hypothetical protein
MWKDPIVEEVRSIREKLAEAHGFDIRKIMADAKSRQGTSGHPLVSFAKGKRSPRAKREATQP